MLLSPEESPNFAMRNFSIEAGGHMLVLGWRINIYTIVSSIISSILAVMFHRHGID